MASSKSPQREQLDAGGGYVIAGAASPLVADSGEERDANGLPFRTYRKDLIRVGDFTKRGTGQTYRITPDVLAQLANDTKKYLSNGNTIPVPSRHDTTGNPDLNRGYLDDVFIDGDSLVGKVRLIGEDGIAAASRSHVSIYAAPGWKDASGNEYDLAISHVALTTDPVVNKQDGFVPIAASNGTVNAELITPKESVMDWNELKEKLGIDGELNDDNAVELICEHVESVKPKRGATVELKAANDRIAELEQENTSLKTSQPMELSNNERGMAKRLINTELDARVKDGNITPAVAEKLRTTLSQGDQMLAFSQSGDPLALSILDALKGNDPVKLGEQTGRQVVELANMPSDDDLDPTLDERRKRAREAAGSK